MLSTFLCVKAEILRNLYRFIGTFLPKYRYCITSNGFELYLMYCDVILLLLMIDIYVYI